MSAYALSALVSTSPRTPARIPATAEAGAIEGPAALRHSVRQTMNSPAHDRFTETVQQLEAQLRESLALGTDKERVMPRQSALREAVELLAQLPAWAPPPHPVIEPTGAIGLEWDLGADRFFVLAVDGTGRIEYSAILGPGEDHYGTTLLSNSVPKRALDLLSELIRT